MLLSIRTLPDPILKSIASPVREITPALRALAQDMLETLHSSPHCVGVAAPQVGESLRLVVINASITQKPHPNHGELVLINPVIIASSGKRKGREGCLSIPDLTANVIRAENVTVEAQNIDGMPLRIDAEGYEAVVLQHEIDHLDGFLFIDRVTSLATDVFRRKNY